MKKCRKILSILLCLVAVLSFSVGCSKSDAEDKVIKVGATQVPGGDLFKYLKDDVKAKGYELEITIFDDYNLPNEALDNGEIDANLDANKDSIYCPKIDGTYTNILVSRTEDLDSDKIQVLKKVLTSDKSKKFLEENYKGVIVPVF